MVVDRELHPIYLNHCMLQTGSVLARGSILTAMKIVYAETIVCYRQVVF